jgi:acyl-CoA thioesterase
VTIDPAAPRPSDAPSEALGIRIVEIGPGRCLARMRVRPDMANQHGICHGGVVFMLGDSTCGHACNCAAPPTVAASAAIEFLTPARVGDELTAVAIERWQEGRGGVYDVTITNHDGRTVAMLRCRSRRLRDPSTAADNP